MRSKECRERVRDWTVLSNTRALSFFLENPPSCSLETAHEWTVHERRDLSNRLYYYSGLCVTTISKHNTVVPLVCRSIGLLTLVGISVRKLHPRNKLTAILKSCRSSCCLFRKRGNWVKRSWIKPKKHWKRIYWRVIGSLLSKIRWRRKIF